MSARLGSPDPTAPRPHREVPGSATKLGTAATLVNATALSVVLPVGGAYRVAVRFKASVGGTLHAALLRPDGVTAYTTGNPADVTVTADTEALLSLDALSGEGNLRLTYTPSGAGTVTYLDVSQLP